MTTPKYEVGARVRVKPNTDIFAGLVGKVVSYDESKPKRPYVVLESCDGPSYYRERYFAEDEIERAPIETKVVEGVIRYDRLGDAFVVNDETLYDFIDQNNVEDGDEVRVIVEVLKRGGAS